MRCLVLLIALAGCGKSEEDAAAANTSAVATPGTSQRDIMIEVWKKAGLAPSAMTAATVSFGKDCQSGTVNNVDVLVCMYASPAEAKAAEKASLEWVGGTTGASWSTGPVLVSAADRHKADPSGRTINKLMKATSPTKPDK